MREKDFAEIAQIFLSATAQDCRQYREAVRDVVQDNVPQAKVSLQENWAEGGHFVVDVCRQRVRDCDADHLKTFQSEFWQPLLAALAGRAPRGDGRLYWFVIDHEPLSGNAAASVRSAALATDDVDYRQLLALPALAEIDARQVRSWLKELKSSAGITLDEARRKEIAEHATAADGKPPNVYDRLAREGFWVQAT